MPRKNRRFRTKETIFCKIKQLNFLSKCNVLIVCSLRIQSASCPWTLSNQIASILFGVPLDRLFVGWNWSLMAPSSKNLFQKPQLFLRYSYQSLHISTVIYQLFWYAESTFWDVLRFLSFLMGSLMHKFGLSPENHKCIAKMINSTLKTKI